MLTTRSKLSSSSSLRSDASPSWNLQLVTPRLSARALPASNEVAGDVDAQYVGPKPRRRQRRRPVAASEIQNLEPVGDSQRPDERLAALPHALRDASEVALLPECLVRIRSHRPPFAGSIVIFPGPSVARPNLRSAFDRFPCGGRALSRRHGVSRQELRHRSSDGLGTLDLQEMTRAFDRAVLDVRE